MRARLNCLGVATFLVLFTAISAHVRADEGSTDEDAAVIDVDPEGQPPGYGKKPRGPRFFVWRDGDTWHVRTKTGGKPFEFSGAIGIKGGKVTKLTNFGGLEVGRGAKKKNRDIGLLNEDQNRISFKFRTAGGEDGFDFKVSDKATEVLFNLKVNGYEHADRISIGGNGEIAPAGGVFRLPAHAPKEETEAATE